MSHTFSANGLNLSYRLDGTPNATPILLIHGFASNKEANWLYPQWIDLLSEKGFFVISLDNRGHGMSDKPHGAEHYRTPLMAKDAFALLDYLGLEKAHIMGYSMGARITAHAALMAPHRVRTALLGGLGSALMTGLIQSETIIHALETPDPSSLTDPQGKMFRTFAEQTGSDLKALADCMRAGRTPITKEQLENWSVPSLISVGTRDSISGSAHELAKYIKGAEVADIPNREHMPAVGDKAHKAAVLQFLEKHS